MKKTLATLWLAWMLAWSPSANAQIDSSKNETKKDLVEVMAKEQAALEEDGKTISFEDVKVLQENQWQLIEEIMKDEKIQELINEYWEEEVQQIITEIITNKDTKEVIEKALKDENIQKALQDWNREGVEKWVQKISEEIYYWLGKVRELKLISTLCGILMGIILRRIRKKDY